MYKIIFGQLLISLATILMGSLAIDQHVSAIKISLLSIFLISVAVSMNRKSVVLKIVTRREKNSARPVLLLRVQFASFGLIVIFSLASIMLKSLEYGGGAALSTSIAALALSVIAYFILSVWLLVIFAREPNIG